MTNTQVFSPSAKRGALRIVGFVIAVLSVIVPALPFGPWIAQPPLPLAVLWASYGWAADDDGSWRRPALLALLGLIHDLASGGHYGLFVAIYLVAFLVGRFMARVTASPNTLSLWGGFIATAFVTSAAAYVLAPIALGGGASARSFTYAAAITALLFPLVRPLYMSAQLVQRAPRRKPIMVRAT